MVSDAEGKIGEATVDRLGSPEAAPGSIGYGDFPDTKGKGRSWIFDIAGNVRVDLGSSCCPHVSVAHHYVMWEDGTVYHRATLHD